MWSSSRRGFPSARISDRIGRKKTIVIAGLGLAVSTFAAASAGGLTALVLLYIIAFYNIFYEVGHRQNGRYSEFYAVTADSIPSDAAFSDTLLALRSVGRGAYWSLYFWMLSDSVNENNRAFEERDFYCVPDRRRVHLSTGTEDYCGYYYNWQSAPGLGSRTTDFHGSPTFGKRRDMRYLDAFYRIHDLDAIPFEDDFTLYWEFWDGWSRIPRSRHCHIGYAIIYYLERSSGG